MGDVKSRFHRPMSMVMRAIGVQLAEGVTERFPFIEGDYMIQVTR